VGRRSESHNLWPQFDPAVIAVVADVVECYVYGHGLDSLAKDKPV